MVMPVDCPLDPVQEQETSREGSQVGLLELLELSTNLSEVTQCPSLLEAPTTASSVQEFVPFIWLRLSVLIAAHND